GSFGGVCFGLLSTFDDPLLQRKGAESHCANKIGALRKPRISKVNVRKMRLRVGYLSADFRAHAVGFLMTGLIEAHDRSFCEVHGFSASADDHSPERKRLVSAFDHLIDVTPHSARELFPE